jgi:hypothetical protein
MAAKTPTKPKSVKNGWLDASLALLVGIAIMGAMVFLAAVLRPPGLAPPPAGAIPMFVFTTTAAAISFVLLRRANPLGYVAAILTGVLPVFIVVLVMTGAFGEIPRGEIQLGPIVFTVLGVALVLATSIAWRKRSATKPAPRSSTPS